MYEMFVHSTQLHPSGAGIPPNIASMATFKLFLSRLLDIRVPDSANKKAEPLLLYNPEVG